MLIYGDRRFVQVPFRNEQEIEDVALANSEHFFGPSSLLIRKTLIMTHDGAGTIPDAYAVDLASRVWYVVEAELSSHDVWGHISPQVSKQIVAARRPETRTLLIEILVDMFKRDQAIRDKFADEEISDIDVHTVLAQILAQPPIVGMPIDAVSEDLRHWAESQKNDVRLWIVRKYAQPGPHKEVIYEIPEEFRPALDTSESSAPAQPRGRKMYDVTLRDLIDAGLLNAGDVLTGTYAPRGELKTTYRATLRADGSLELGGDEYSSPSDAALACLKNAGSDRHTVNGWTHWRREGKRLADIRQQYLESKPTEPDAEDSARA